MVIKAKRHILLLTLIFSTLWSVCAYASYFPAQDEYFRELESFAITGGIEWDAEKESTFDATRTITGTAEKKTNVVITVFQPCDDNDYSENEVVYTFEVGVSGIFSQVIELPVGENHIRITATKDDRKTERTVIINRKDMEIKRELEQGIALPGKKK